MENLQALTSALESLRSGLDAFDQRNWPLGCQYMTQCLSIVKPFLLRAAQSSEANFAHQATIISFHEASVSGKSTSRCPLTVTIVSQQANPQDFKAVAFVAIYDIALIHQQLSLKQAAESQVARKAATLFEKAHAVYIDSSIAIPETMELSLLYNLAQAHKHIGNGTQHESWMRCLFDSVVEAEYVDEEDEAALAFFHATVMEYFFHLSTHTAAAA